MGWWPCGGCSCACSDCNAGTTPSQFEIVLSAPNESPFGTCKYRCAELIGTWTLDQVRGGSVLYKECCYWEKVVSAFDSGTGCQGTTLQWGALDDGSGDWRFWINDGFTNNNEYIDFDPTSEGGAEWSGGDCSLELTYTTSSVISFHGTTCSYPSSTLFTFTPL